MENPNIKKFYQQSAKPFNYVPNDLVDGAPGIPPLMSGLMKIDPSTGNIWISAGNTLVSDWKLITGGGGGGTYTVDNGLTESPVGNFQLGGTLISDVTIEGDKFTFLINNLAEFGVAARDKISFVADGGAAGLGQFLLDTTVGQTLWQYDDGAGGVTSIEMSGGKMYIKTPSYSTAANGSSLKLIDNTTGEVEFSTLSGETILLATSQDIGVGTGYNNITDFSIPLVTGKSYSFKATILYTVGAPTVESSWGYKITTANPIYDAGVVIFKGVVKDIDSSNSTIYLPGEGTALIEGVLNNVQFSDNFNIIVSFQDTIAPIVPCRILAGSSFIYYEI
jgi:hypothetical protein